MRPISRRAALPLLAAPAFPESLNSLRIQTPRNSSQRLLFVLPVNPKSAFRWGDGFQLISQLNLHHQYGFTLVAPAFDDWPWFADHPTNPSIRQESFLLHQVLPHLDSQFPNHRRLLVGFSKSGNGAFSLLLRHPHLFHAAAAWDAPLMKTAPDQWEMPNIFGTSSNFQHYAIPNLLRRQAPLLQPQPPRLYLSGYDAFQTHTRDAHSLMQTLRIPHLYDNSTRRPHRWDSGWLPPALAALHQLSS